MNNNISQLPVGKWNVNYMSKTRIFPKKCEEESMEIISEWTKCFPKESTFVQKEYNVPSLIIRFDCVINENNNNESGLEIPEIEERPAGLGVSSKINPEFKENFDNIRKTWPTDVIAIISPRRQGYDDGFWTKVLIGSDVDIDGKLALVRAEPQEKDFLRFLDFSISTIRTKGMKLYGEKMGLWHIVSHEDFTDLPWLKGFVLKPIQGSKCIDICIWPPQELKSNKNKKGISSRKRIGETLLKYGKMYCQKFIRPMDSGLPEFDRMIYRVYFGYNIDFKKWEFLGGLWNARSNWLIHGASDAVFGPIVKEY